MQGREIEIEAADGGTFQGYLSLPEGGTGPGLVVLQEIFGVNAHIREVCDTFAEEGYVTLAPDLFWRVEPGLQLGYGDADREKAFAVLGRFDEDRCAEDIAQTVAHLRAHEACEGGVGAMGFCLGGKLAYLAATRAGVECAIGYYGVGIENNLDELDRANCPILLHFAGEDSHVPPASVAKIEAACAEREATEIHTYPGAEHGFNCDARPSYSRPTAIMAHSRSIALLRRTLGPRYDLSGLWDEHCACEFGARDAKATMDTMVAEPYVNHIPTLTGGVGYRDLYRFYKNHFIPKTPADTSLTPISRTVGADRVVDEMVFSFTHDIEIDWMLPGIAPTGRKVEVPLVAIVCFRGGRLYNEHIYWDQASVLAQIGLLDPAKLPIAGVETARKLVDETLPSNAMMAKWAKSEGLD